MKTKTKMLILVVLLIALTLPAYAGGIVEAITGGGSQQTQTPPAQTEASGFFSSIVGLFGGNKEKEPASSGNDNVASGGDGIGFFSSIAGLFGGNKDSDASSGNGSDASTGFFSSIVGLFGGNKDSDASGGSDAGTGFFSSIVGLFGGNKDSDDSSGNDSGGSGGIGGFLSGLFGGGNDGGSSSASGSSGSSGGGSGGGGIGWTEIGIRDLDKWPNGTWVATYAMSIMDGIEMTIVQTVAIRGGTATSNVTKQTFSGSNVNMIWPMLKMSYESGLTPGTHRINDSQRTIDTTYDPNDPIYSGAAYERTGSEDMVHVYINAARNRIRVVVDVDSNIMPEIVYVKR